MLILLYFGIVSFFIDTEIGIFGDLFHSTAITSNFALFIYILASSILLTITAYLKAANCLAIELQNYGLYIFATSLFLSTQILTTTLCPLSFILGWDDFSLLLSVVPVASYSNADTQKIQFLCENKNKSGIYRWINKENGNSYIGSAVDLRKRFYLYYNLEHISKVKMLICRALLKYGYSNFSLEILEYCKPDNVIEREQYYLDLLKPEYNILKTAGSCFGYRHREETLIKFRARKWADGTKAKMAAAKLGRKHTEETRTKIIAVLQKEEVQEKMQAAALKRKGRELSEETKAKMRASQSKRIKHPVPGIKIEVTEIETGISTVYETIRETALALNIGAGTISRRIKLNIIKPYKGKFLIKTWKENEGY